MSHLADSLANLPLDALEQIDRICEWFEAEWSSGSAPSLADYVAEAPSVGQAPSADPHFPLSVDL